MSRADEVLDSIDHALNDYDDAFGEGEMTPDAMRWSPEPSEYASDYEPPVYRSVDRNQGQGWTSAGWRPREYRGQAVDFSGMYEHLYLNGGHMQMQPHVSHFHVSPFVPTADPAAVDWTPPEYDTAVVSEDRGTVMTAEGEPNLRRLLDEVRTGGRRNGRSSTPPPPDSHHPHYNERDVRVIRAQMAAGVHHIDVFDATDGRRTLRIDRAGRTLPDGTQEQWRVAFDELDRWVAGPAIRIPRTSYHWHGPARALSDVLPVILDEAVLLPNEVLTNLAAAFARLGRHVREAAAGLAWPDPTPVRYFDVPWSDLRRRADLPPGVRHADDGLRFVDTVNRPEPRAPRQPLEGDDHIGRNAEVQRQARPPARRESWR